MHWVWYVPSRPKISKSCSCQSAPGRSEPSFHRKNGVITPPPRAARTRASNAPYLKVWCVSSSAPFQGFASADSDQNATQTRQSALNQIRSRTETKPNMDDRLSRATVVRNGARHGAIAIRVARESDPKQIVSRER